MEQGLLRFVKWKRTKRGGFIAKCMGMRRIEPVKDKGYRFRCITCHRENREPWVWPSDGVSLTLQRAPLEVRLHILLHHPDRRWAKMWRTPRLRKTECPSCGFNLTSFGLPPKAKVTVEDED